MWMNRLKVESSMLKVESSGPEKTFNVQREKCAKRAKEVRLRAGNIGWHFDFNLQIGANAHLAQNFLSLFIPATALRNSAWCG